MLRSVYIYMFCLHVRTMLKVKLHYLQHVLILIATFDYISYHFSYQRHANAYQRPDNSRRQTCIKTIIIIDKDSFQP